MVRRWWFIYVILVLAGVVLAGQWVRYVVRPGGMFSDVGVTDLTAVQHQEVVNLRQNKLGEWETVRGFVVVDTGFGNIKAGCEVTDDITGERFLLVQDGKYLVRVDWDDDDGYMGAAHDTLDLPWVDVLKNGRMEEKVNIFKGNLLAESWEHIGSHWDSLIFYDINGIKGKGQGISLLDLGGTYPGTWYGIRQKIDKKYLDRFPARVKFSAWIKSDTVFTIDILTIPAGTPKAQFVTEENLTTWKKISWDSEIEIENPFYSGEYFTLYVRDSTSTIDTLFIDDLKMEIPVVVGDDVLRFSSYNGVVRIMGGSKPLSYFYVDRTFFPDTDSTFTVKGWQLTESEVSVENKGIYLKVDSLGTSRVIGPSTSGFKRVYVKIFGIMDDGEYSLLSDVYNYYSGHILGAGVKLIVEKDSSLLRRITDVGIVYSSVFMSDSLDTIDVENLTSGWNIGMIVSLTKKPNKLRWTQWISKTSTSDSLVFYYGSADGGFACWQNGYFNEGLSCSYQTNESIYRQDFSIDSVIYWSGGARYKALKITPALNYVPDNRLVNFEIQPEWKWDAAGQYYYIWVGVEFANGGTDFYDLSGIPAGTKDINPNYSHHVIIGDRAFCLSLEDEEEDVIRYSPSYQWDVFPNLNIMQTGVGTSDRNVAIVNVNDRLVVMKKRSLTQGQFNNGSFYQDVGFSKNGLYAPDGWTLLNNDLYFMDQGDVFGFNGINITGIMASEGLRERYRDSVSTDGLLFWNKLDNELWVVNGSDFLVWQPERGAWYIRDTDVVPSCGFLDFDNRLLLCDANRVVTFDHDSTQFDEAVGWSFKTKVFDAGGGWSFKKLQEFYLRGKGSVDCQVYLEDVADGTRDSVAVDLDSARVVSVRESPNFLFRELEVEVESDSADSSMQATLRDLQLRVMVW